VLGEATHLVAAARPQRRHGDLHHAEAVEEVFGSARRRRGPRGRGASPPPPARRRAASRPPTRSKARSCRRRSSFACTVGASSPTSSRKSVPPSAALDLARHPAVGAGEAPALVAEELALDERLGERGAVDGHEGPLAPRGCWRGWPARRAPCPCPSRRAAAPWRRPPRPAHLLVDGPHRGARPDDVVEHPAHLHPPRAALGGAQGGALQRQRDLRCEGLEEGSSSAVKGPSRLLSTWSTPRMARPRRAPGRRAACGW
jgi:hypothetical protein